MRRTRFRGWRRLVGLLLAGGVLWVVGISAAAATESDGPKLPMAAPVRLPYEKVLPGPIDDYEIMTASGEFPREYLMRVSRLRAEGFSYVQTIGRSSSGMKPWLMARNVKTGKGIAVSLAYSGNWVLCIERQGEQTVLRAATSPASLPPFETIGGLPIPGALVAEFSGDWDNGAQPITRFIRKKLLRDMGPDWPPVQYNTWYANFDRLSEQFVRDAARAAAEVGCELFTVDAGWFGESMPKAGWIGALGDWHVNREKFPNGLEPIADEVRRLGMKFGLWIEIERVAPDAPVMREHPDWYLRDGDKRFSRKGSYALDFGNPEVVAWAKAEIDRLAAAYRLDYLKMDFNSDLTIDSQRFEGGVDPLYRHYRGLVELWQYLRAKHPRMIVENCSSGSLRHDVMTAALTDTQWVSDNVTPSLCLAMNHGATYLFPAETCSHWTILPIWQSRRYTAAGADRKAMRKALDLPSLFTVNMMGHFGLSGPIDQWDAEARAIAAERIALYKRIRPIVRNADVYHLTPQADPDAPRAAQAALYVDSGTQRAVLFAFQANDPRLEIGLRMRGLLPERSYRVVPPEAFGPARTYLGRDLIEKGLVVRFPNRGGSAVILIEPQ
ncbi:MAG: alpha-galactosidase [Pirellulales bacterium]|nr:alpha-galactosidase [Pirellulales bacterium]